MSTSVSDLLRDDLSGWGIGEWGTTASGEALQEDARLSVWCRWLPMILLSARDEDSIRIWWVERHDDRDWICEDRKTYSPAELAQVADLRVTLEACCPHRWAALAQWALFHLFPAYERLAGERHACEARVSCLYQAVVMSEEFDKHAA